MSGYRRYDEYKNSGVEWIGEIPKGWEVRKIKYEAFINKNVLSETVDDDYEITYIDIGSVNSFGEIRDLQNYQFIKAPSRARRVVTDGDTIVSTVRTYLKAIAFIHKPRQNLICSTGFTVLSPSENLIPKYLFYLMRSENYVNEIVKRSVGVSYPAVNASDIGNLECLLPNMQTQQAIVDFLNQKTAEIDGLIADKERMIELLQEHRQAIISEAVTKGLNPDVKMKDSGIEWIGEIPEHWDIINLKNILLLNDGGTWGDEFDNNGVIVLRSTEIEVNGSWNICEPAKRNISLKDTRRYLLKEGDLLVTKSSGSKQHIGKTAIVDKTVEELNCVFSNFMQRLRVNKNNSPKFIYYFINSYLGRSQFQYLTTTTTGLGNISASTLNSLIVPDVEFGEQQSIADFLDQKTAEIDELVSDIQLQIEKLKEYRQSLISEAVTGKIHVRDYESN